MYLYRDCLQTHRGRVFVHIELLMTWCIMVMLFYDQVITISLLLLWYQIEWCSGNNIWGYIQKFLDWVDNEINNNKHSLRSNTKGYGGKTH
jgi:hypothetical protein